MEEAIAAFKELSEKKKEITDRDIESLAAQEMRSYVCGQCHVEYYFKGDEKRLTFPWSKGLKAEDMYAYYEEAKFRDFVHKETGAPVLKAQHPEFEMWSQGVHARSGVACASFARVKPSTPGPGKRPLPPRRTAGIPAPASPPPITTAIAAVRNRGRYPVISIGERNEIKVLLSGD
jgi:hypothetical protein